MIYTLNIMKNIKVDFIEIDNGGSIENMHAALDHQVRHVLEFHPWKKKDQEFTEVSFSIAHDNRSILLKFFVAEKEMRAEVTKINGPVWEDSCVEFFVSFDNAGYYNFEFNVIGTVLAAFGKNRHDRAFLPEEMLRKIRTHARSAEKREGYYWEMIVVIPIELFIYHPRISLNEVTCRGNFYKCGDGLIEPHYLCWSNIVSERPDFHLPEFFGKIAFE